MRPDQSALLRQLLEQRIIVLDALPMSPIGKIAKSELRADMKRRVEAGQMRE